MRRTILAGALLCAALTAGCSSAGAPTPAPSTTATAHTASATPTGPSTSTEASASATGAAATALGAVKTLTGEGTTTTLTVTAYRVIALGSDNQEGLPAGAKVGLVSVRQCVTAGAAVVMSWAPWTLLTSLGESVQALGAWGTRDFPGPLYDNDSSQVVPDGACRSGYIPFSLQGLSGKVDQVEYSFDTTAELWAING